MIEIGNKVIGKNHPCFIVAEAVITPNAVPYIMPQECSIDLDELWQLDYVGFLLKEIS